MYQLRDPNNTLNNYKNGMTRATSFFLFRRLAKTLMITLFVAIIRASVKNKQRNHARSGCSSWSRSNGPISFCNK